MKRRYAGPILAGILALGLLGGCWDRLEIEDRAAVIAVGLDPAASGSGLRLSAQIGIPGKIPLGQAGGGGGGTTNPRETVYVDAADGRTIEDALNSLQQTLNNEIFLGHLRIIAVNEQLAHQGLGNLIDYFHRSAQTRRTSWVLVSADPASDVMNASPAFSRVPGLFFTDMMEHYVNMGLLPPIFLGTFLVSTADQGQDALLPYVWAQGQGARLLGAAVFRGDQMVGSLSTADLQFVEDVVGPSKAAQILDVPIPGTPGGSVRLQIIDRHAEVKPSLVDGQPRVDIKLRLEANVVQESGVLQLKRGEVLDQVSAAGQKLIDQNIRRVLAATQAEHADVFGFGEQFRGKMPQFFRRYVGTKDVWDAKYYPKLIATVDARLLIRRIGMENR